MKRILIIFCILWTWQIVFPQNPRNVLIYNLTSTDCGPCSCMDSILHNSLLPLFPNTVIVALHGIGSGFNQYQGDSARNYFHAQYEPSGFIDGLGRDCPYLEITDSAASRYASSPEAPVEIYIGSKAWDDQTRQVSLSVTFTNTGNEMPGTYRYNIIVTEDHIKHVHRTMTGCSTPDVQGLPFRNEYFNDWVTRTMVLWSNGDSLIGPSWPAGGQVTRTCTFDIDTAWIPQNSNIVVTVYKHADSLYKAPVQQAIRQSVTGGMGSGEENPSEDGIQTVFPNPASGMAYLHIAVKQEGFCNVSLYDERGKMVQSLVEGIVRPGFYNIEIPLDMLPAGIYLAVMTTPSIKISRKMLILK